MATKALRFHAVVRGKALPLPDLSAFEGKRVEVIVLAEEEGAEAPAEAVAHATAGTPAGGGAIESAAAPALRRRLGALQGQLVVHDDFDDPLPEDIQKYFEGRGDEVDE